ncbi:MAG: LysM peptidoglycan-binding domain-containing protein [Phascolarctobacterium sp.]|nr:LysM peptidoglycan-binding domain-containing protein [Phascolarctobacterium sp.]
MKGILYATAFACAIYAGAGDLFAATPVYRDYSVTVAQGDTLWDIACRHAEAKEDVRLVMERITKANHLDAGRIYPGQVIKVPLRMQESGLMIATK